METLEQLLTKGSQHDNQPLQIYRSSNLKKRKIFIYVCLVYMSQEVFYKMFPMAVPITEDELNQLLSTYEKRITLVEIDTTPILDLAGKPILSSHEKNNEEIKVTRLEK